MFSDYDLLNPGLSGDDGIVRPTYTCIMGSDIHPSTDTTAPNGPVSGGGILVLGGGIKIAMVTDGTSNTLMVGETSDFAIDGSGVQQDILVDNDRGFHMGTSYVSRAPNGPGSMTAVTPAGSCTSANGNCSRCYNTTTIRYGVNNKSFQFNY